MLTLLLKWWLKIRERLTGRPFLHPALHKQRQIDQQLVVKVSVSRWPSWSQFKKLPCLLSRSERFWIWFLLLVVVSGGVWLGERIYRRAAKIIPIPGGSYVEGLVGMPQYINPLLGMSNDTDRDLSRLMFCSLTKLSSDGQIINDLADKIDLSSDGLTYTITLKNNATWHDGTPVTTADVEFTVASLQDETWNSPVGSIWANVDVQSLDDRMVILHLPRAMPDFFSMLTVGLLPAHLWQEIPTANIKLTPLNLQPVGCGPFAFSSLSRDWRGNLRSLSMHRYESYYGSKPYLDEISFKFYPDYDTAIAALKNGNIQGLTAVPAVSVKEIVGRHGLTMHNLSIPQYTAIFFNFRNNGQFKQLEVRQALKLAVDRQVLVTEAMNNQAQVVDGPALLSSDQVNSGADLKAAKELLTKGGWKEVDNTWQKDKQTLMVKLLAADRPEHKAIAERVSNNWRALGVAVEVELVPRQDLRDRIKENNFDLVIFSESLGLSGDPFAFWHSSQIGSGGLNISGWSSRDSDVLLEQAQSSSDFNKRQEALRKFQDIIKQNVPAIFLYSPTLNYPVTSLVKGIRADRLGTPADRFSGITDWYIKTKRKL